MGHVALAVCLLEVCDVEFGGPVLAGLELDADVGNFGEAGQLLADFRGQLIDGDGEGVSMLKN